MGYATDMNMKILTAKLTVSTRNNLTDAQLEEITEMLSDIGFLDKLYGTAREMLREYFDSDRGLDVDLE